MIVYLQTLTRFHQVNVKQKLLLTSLIVLVAAPISGFAIETNPTNGDDARQEEIKRKEAKEDTLGVYESENKVNDGYQLEDQLLLIPQEPVISERTSTSYTTTQETNKGVATEEDPNAAMSFNFIYYIIDKFKLADPLD